MSFEESVAMVFQPGMFEIFCLAVVFVALSMFFFVIFAGLLDLISALIRRFVWPGTINNDVSVNTPGSQE